MTSTEDAAIETDGVTVWVNAKDGSCIGRFGKYGIDIHTTASAQMTGAGQCLQCTRGQTCVLDWREFQDGMQHHYKIEIGDQWMPSRFKP